jgi:hypothetical protein
MKEFFLLVRSKGDPMASMPKDTQAAHVLKVGEYINGLMVEGKLKSAQPFKPQGAIVMKKDDKLGHIAIDASREIVSGYYHILAQDLDEAIKIAKMDPRFEDGNWKIEVRPVMTVEGIN